MIRSEELAAPTRARTRGDGIGRSDARREPPPQQPRVGAQGKEVESNGRGTRGLAFDHAAHATPVVQHSELWVKTSIRWERVWSLAKVVGTVSDA